MDLLDFYLVQLINRGVTVLFIYMTLVVAYHMYREVKVEGLSRYRLRGVFSLLLLFSGMVIKTGVIVWVRYLGDNHLQADWIVRHQDHLLIVGTTLLFYGGLHFLRVWSPERWGNIPWVCAAISAVIVALL